MRQPSNVIDHEKLTVQANSDTFGPVEGNETNQFRTTSRFQLGEEAKAYSMMKGQIILIQDKNFTDLVTLVLKPHESLKFDFTGVKYFVYRGLKRDGFIATSGGADVITPKASTNNQLIERLWATKVMNTNYWTKESPIFPVLKEMADNGKYKNLILSIYDSEDEIIKELEKFTNSL